jgi:hypothetical protein
MPSCDQRVMALGFSAVLLSVAAGLAAGQGPKSVPAADGLLRAELSLLGRTATVAYSPLRADDAVHRDILSAAPGPASARLRIARLVTTGPLRVGISTEEIGKPAAKPDPGGIKYDLWLTGTTDGWQLQLTDVATEAAGTAEPPSAASIVAQTPLSRQTATTNSPTLIAALVPETGDSARLVLRWGKYEAATAVAFPPQSAAAKGAANTPPPNVTTNRTHDEDLSVMSRFLLLAVRNETAIGLTNGARLSVSFPRTPLAGERPPATAGGGRGSKGLSVDGPDFARLSTTPAGAVVLLTSAPVPRVKIDAPLRFGKTTIATHNLGPGFPGSYGLWLKRVGSGWRLVFNNEPDAWGSQYDAKFDAAEIDLAHSDGHDASRPFAMAITSTAPDRGRLIIIWGPHEWTADFVVAG